MLIQSRGSSARGSARFEARGARDVFIRRAWNAGSALMRRFILNYESGTPIAKQTLVKMLQRDYYSQARRRVVSCYSLAMLRNLRQLRVRFQT
jgi:hypothetical protein